VADLSALLERSRRSATPPRRRTAGGFRTVAANDPRLAQIRRNQARAEAARSQLVQGFTPAAFTTTASAGVAGQLRGRPRSTKAQLSDALTGIPQGVAGLVGQAAVTTAAPVRFGVDLAQGDIEGDGALGGLRHYLPLPTAIGESAVQTSQRFGPLVQGQPGPLLGAYKQASDEGRIVDMLLEDIGNLGMFAGGVSKVLGTASRTVTVTPGSARWLTRGRGGRGGLPDAAIAPGSALRSALDKQQMVQGVRVNPLSGVPAADRVVGPLGAVAPRQVTVTQPGSGLAGALGKAGATTAERRLATAGKVVYGAGRLGESVDVVQFALPLRAALGATKAATSPLRRGVQGRLAAYVAQNPGTSFAERFTDQHKQTRGELADVKDDVLHNAVVQSDRRHIQANIIADRYKLDRAQKSAATLSVDQRFLGYVDMYRRAKKQGLDDATAGNIVARSFADEPSGLVLTIEDVIAYDDWKTGRLDDKTSAGMDLVDEAVRQNADIFTQQLTETVDDQGRPLLAPEQLENEWLPDIVEGVRSGIERERDAKIRELDRKVAEAAPHVRRAEVHAAINTQLPDAPNARVWFEAGQEAALSKARYDAMRIEHQRAQGEVKTALDRWERAAKDASVDAGTLRRLASELDRKTNQANELAVEIERATRLADATFALSRVDATETQTLPENPELPDVDYSDLPTATAIRDAVRDLTESQAGAVVDDISADWGVQIVTRIEDTKADGSPRERPGRVTRGEGSVPIMVFTKTWYDDAGNRHTDRVSHWEDAGVDPRSKVGQRLIREGFIGRADEGKGAMGAERRGIPFDQFPDPAGRVGAERRFHTPHEAFTAYVADIKHYWEAKARGNDVAVHEVAEVMGLSPTAVRAALDSAAEFRAEAVRARVASLQSARDVFQGLSPDVRTGFMRELNEMREAGAPDVDLREYIAGTLDAYAPGGAREVFADLGDIDVGDLADYIRGEAIPRTVLDINTRADRPAVAADKISELEGYVNTARRQLAITKTDQRSIGRILDRARGDAGRRETRARGEHEAAATAEAAALDDLVDAAEGVQAQQAPTTDTVAGSGNLARTVRDPYRRRKVTDPETGEVTVTPSRVERARIEEGVLNQRAATAQAEVGQISRSIDRYNREIGNLSDELGRTFQQRLHKKNRGAIRGMSRIIRGIEKPLGRLVRGDKDTPPRVTGLMGDIARRHGFHDELVAALDAEIRNADPDIGVFPVDLFRAFRQTADTYGAGIPFRLVTDSEWAQLERSWNVDQLLATVDAIVAQENMIGAGANAPFRVHDHINQAMWVRLDGKKMGFPDDTMTRVADRYKQYIAERARHLDETYDKQAAVMPGRWRAIGSNNRRLIRGLLDEAEALVDVDPVSANMLIRMAEDVPTTMQQLIARGYDPVHLTGGEAPGRAVSTSGGGIPDPSIRAQHVLSRGFRPVDLSGVVQLQINQANKFLQKQAARHIRERMSKPAQAVIGEQYRAWQEANQFSSGAMPDADFLQALQDTGWALPPGVSKSGLTLNTPVVPRLVAQELSKMDSSPSPAYRALDFFNRVFKTSVLPLSTRWLTGNLFGNMFMAMVHGQMTPVQLLSYTNQIARMSGGWDQLYRQGGLPDFVPDELASHGLTYNEHVLRWGDDSPRGRSEFAGIREVDTAGGPVRDRFKRFVAWSYNLNEFVDNVGRSAVFLAELERAPVTQRQGFLHSTLADTSIEKRATQAALRAMGDFTRMTTFERRYVRQVYPFYAWLRHQTVAAMRLPLQSPTRAAFMAHLSNLMTDPDMEEDVLRRLGSSIPIGGDRYLNIGGINPFGDIRHLPLDPTRPDMFVGGVSPAIDVPFRAIGGFDLGRLRPVTRPYEDRAEDEWGNLIPLSPFRRALGGDPLGALGEIGYQATGELPQTRALRDLMLGPGEFRYGSGQRPGHTEYDRPMTLTNVLSRAAQIPRVDTGEQMGLADIARRARERERLARRR